MQFRRTSVREGRGAWPASSTPPEPANGEARAKASAVTYRPAESHSSCAPRESWSAGRTPSILMLGPGRNGYDRFMAVTRSHTYRVQTNWTGNLGTGTSAYVAY